MAEEKKTVVVYTNWQKTFENLLDDEAGRLIKHFFRYVNDQNPEPPDRITELVFEPIKAVLKSDLQKYIKVKEDKSIQGRLGNLKRWNNDLFLLVENKTFTLEEAENIVNQRKLSLSDKKIADAIKPSLKIADNDNDNVNGNVNDNVNDIIKEDAENFSSKNFDDDFIKFQALFFKNYETFDFEKNISEILEKQNLVVDQNEKVYLSQCLNFLREQKRKKVPPKKEKTHESFSESLIELDENKSWRETIYMQQKLNDESLKQKLQDFNSMLSVKKRIHKSEREYLDHFTNWLPTQVNSFKKQTSPELIHNR